MEIRTLKYFLAVAREQNMTEAANVLFVTQPTLSRQMADLEKELGKKLFVRTNRSTTLTEEGMHLRQRAEEILALVDQTKEEIREDDMDLSGCIRIGAGETKVMHWITDTFAELHQDYPRLTIELFTNNADGVQERLEHGLLDFGLFIEPFNLEKYNSLRLPEKDQIWIVTSSQSPWASLDRVTPEDFLQMPLLVSSRTASKNFDFTAWSQGKVTPDKIHAIGRFDLLGNASLLVRTGCTNLISLNTFFQEGTPGLKFIPLDPPLFTTSVVAWKKFRLLSRSSQVFLDRLKQKLSDFSH